MPSYYNRIKGTLEPTKLAKASDINLIQSSIQDAVSNVIIDMFGPSFMLGEAENDLKLIPTPIHTDQANFNYDEEDQWISFYERYFRQPLFIEMSSIESIKLCMINDSNITTTVYAEIRDINYNLLKETGVKLEPTTNGSIQEVTFNFNLDHLGVGRYYFVLKPVDISAADLAINGDETEYDTITADMFCVRYDRNGNYEAGLEASYNGVDYLEAYMLEDMLEYQDEGATVTYENNFDLYFEHVFSSGNTYLINPGAAVVHGQKVYPMDTHVTIAGPSTTGDRTDLVILTQEGYLKVIQGTAYNGAMVRPQSDSGLKIAYITSYKSENSDWVCPNCHVTNEGNVNVCYNCGTSVNTRIPLIEQTDDNGMTRQRDVLERLRRLEKMMTYEQEYNRPTRVKYTCSADPIIFQSKNNLTGQTIKNDTETVQFTDADGSYGVTTEYINGEYVNKITSLYDTETHAWAIRKNKYDITTFAEQNITEPGTLYVWDLINYDKKPTGQTPYGCLISFRVENQNGNGMPNIPIEITINGPGVQLYTKQVTNVNGNIRLDPYNLGVNFATGTYNIEASHNGKKVSATYGVIRQTNAAKDIGMNLNVLDMDKYNKTILSSTGVVIDSTGQQLISQTILVCPKAGSSGHYFSYLSKDKDTIKNAGEIYKVLKKSCSPLTIKRHGIDVDVITGSYIPEPILTTAVPDNVNLGVKKFFKDNATLNDDKGTFEIAKVLKEGTGKNASAKALKNDPELYGNTVNNGDYGYETNSLISDTKQFEAKETVYKINNNIKKLDSEYPVLNFHHDGGYVHSLTPYIKKFKNIESFQIILFKNEITFGQTENHRLSYQKKINDDTTFPNIYVSPMIAIDSSAKTDIQGNKILYNYHKFIIDKDIPKGNYSLFFYAKLAEGYSEGAIFVDQYVVMSEGDTYGTATKVKGSCNPSLIYLETNTNSSETWDLLIEKISDEYKASGIVISEPIKCKHENYSIHSVSLDYNCNIPNGCDLYIQVSNDGGRNWVTVRNTNNYVKFSGAGNVFEWKVVMKGNGVDTPTLYFDKSKGYAIQAKLNTVSDLQILPYEDYGRCLMTPVMDFTAITYKLFGDSTITQQDFSEWEWVRLFMEDDERTNQIYIYVSNGNTDNDPIYVDENIDTWNTNLFFHQIICGLTLDDFEHTSVDYSNYDPNLEHDEYNFRFKYDVELSETYGSGVIAGDYRNAVLFKNHPKVESSRFEVYNKNTIQYVYKGNADDRANRYGGTHVVAAPYYGVKYLGPEDSSKKYFNSEDDDTYDKRTVITGMVFENGLEIDEKFLDLTLDIFVSMNDAYKDERPSGDNLHIKYDENGNPIQKKDEQGNPMYTDVVGVNPIWEEESPTSYFPAKTFKLVVSLNPYGLMDENLTYGKIYDIDKPLYDSTYNRISIPLFDDFVGSTIYSIGIIAVDNPTESIGPSGNGALREGDIIGLADLRLNGYDRRLYWPSQENYAWHKGGTVREEDELTLQHSYACIVKYLQGAAQYQERDIVFPLSKLDSSYGYDYRDGKVNDIREIIATSTKKIETERMDITPKNQTQFIVRNGGLGGPVTYAEQTVEDLNGKTINAKDIYIENNKFIAPASDGTRHEMDIEFPEVVFTFLHEPAVKEPSFYIDVDFSLDPYSWVRIEHWLEAETIDKNKFTDKEYELINDGITYTTKLNENTYTKTYGQIHAGDIVFEFYDTRDHINSEPVETYTLPAWGRIQTRAKTLNKEVNAWFKIRNSGRIKRIVVKRKNPTGDNCNYPLKLHLFDIGMHRGKTMPALGSQLQMRIYPQAESFNNNTSVRKVGAVYRIA